jgi:hypothetical protein
MKDEVLFKIQGDIVLIESGDIDLAEVDHIKHMISEECEVDFDDVEVVFIKGNDYISDFEVNSKGKLVNYIDNIEVNKVTFGGEIDDFLDIFTKKTSEIDQNNLYLLN